MRNEVSQDLMGFWTYESLFLTICSSSVLFNSNELGFDFFALAQ